jgi:uracil-DNA glycosylase
MLLGRDFGTKTYYQRLCGIPPRDETASTWRRTRDIYLASFIGLPVWCTNYIVGVRKNGSSVGNVKERIHPSDWEAFEGDCWQFLQAQVLLQHPRILVVFGGDNRADLAANGRLGEITQGNMRHTFKNEYGQHSVLVTYADHPHSLIPKEKQEDARKESARLRHLYQGITQCRCRDGES